MTRIHKDWLKAYTIYTEPSESPDLFHFWTGVSTVAGALRRRVWIDQGIFQWTPNFYVIFVAPPGIVSKSTTLDLGMSLLKEIEGIHFGPSSCTWQALGQKFQQAHELVPLDGVDYEGDLDEMSCLTCAFSELGTFLDFKDQKLASVLIDLWDGRRANFEHSTATSSQILIKNPWLNMIGATTPSWLKTNAPAEFIGGGLASRIVFVYGNKKRKLVPYPGLVREREESIKLREELIHDLTEIASMYGEYRLTQEAIQVGAEHYIHHWNNRDLHMASERYEGYLARKQSHIHKLAMIFAATRSDELWITEKHVKDAITIITAMEADMINVFESVGVTPMSRMLSEILIFIDTYQKQNVPVSRRMLWRHCIQIMTEKEFSEITSAAINAGYLKLFQTENDIYYKIMIDPRQLKEEQQG